jgi:hypothetical protein
MSGSVKEQLGVQPTVWTELPGQFVAQIIARPWEALAHLTILTVCAVVLWRTPLGDKTVEKADEKVAAAPVEAEKKPKGKFYDNECKS